ncbi:MAG: dienelactone hydrolase family protein [Alphaproteobacteria bacterium]|nr:dienelactone hydrolase family protein [Alphaproteobacteria bacterium]
MRTLFFATLALCACAEPATEDPFADLPFAPAGPGSAPDPSTWGPFPVGVTTLTFTDPDRTLEDGSPRIVPVEVWYPAASADGTLRIYDLADEVPPERLELEGITPDDLPDFASNSLDEALPDTTHGPFPLVIFSHGNGGMRLQSVFLTEVLASHGYVVAAPDHVGNTLGDMLVPGMDELASTTESFRYRPDDIHHVLEMLWGQDDVAPVSDGLWGMSGHSLGGFSALRAAGMEPDVGAVVAEAPPDAALALAGTGTDPDELEMPVLIQAGTDDQILDYEDNAVASFAELTAPAFLATYYDAGHFTFSDLCVLELGPLQEVIRDSVGNVLEDGCGADNLPPELALPLIRHHAIALFNGALRDSPESAALVTASPGAAYEGVFELEGGY